MVFYLNILKINNLHYTLLKRMVKLQSSVYVQEIQKLQLLRNKRTQSNDLTIDTRLGDAYNWFHSFSTDGSEYQRRNPGERNFSSGTNNGPFTLPVSL